MDHEARKRRLIGIVLEKSFKHSDYARFTVA